MSGLAELSQPYCDKILALWDVMEMLNEGVQTNVRNGDLSREGGEKLLTIKFAKNIENDVDGELFDQIRCMGSVTLLSKMFTTIHRNSLPGIVSNFGACHRYISNFKVSQEEIATALSQFFINSIAENQSQLSYGKKMNFAQGDPETFDSRGSATGLVSVIHVGTSLI